MFGLINTLAKLALALSFVVPTVALAQVDAPTIALPEMSIKVGGGDGNLVESLKVG